MAAAPSASVVIPVLNGRFGLERLLDTLNEQTVRHRLEVIVVDNGSIDGSQRVAARLADVVLEVRGGNGSSAARNAGLRLASHPFLLTTDADCVPTDRDWADTHLTAMAHAAADVLASAGPLVALACDDSWAMRADITPHPAFTVEGVPAFAVNGNACYRTDLLRELGGYPDFGANDSAIGKLAARHGLTFVWVPAASVFHENKSGARAYLAQRRKVGVYAAEINGRPASWPSYAGGVLRQIGSGLRPLAALEFVDAFARAGGAAAMHAGALPEMLGAPRRRPWTESSALAPAAPSSVPAYGPGSRTVDICICTRDRPLELARALASIAHSTYPVNQIIVSDDAAGSDTREVCEQAGRRLPIPTRYTRSPGRGASANRNHAVRFATADLVLFIDDDCLLGETFLAVASACLRRAERRLGDNHVIVSGAERNGARYVTAHAQTFLGFQARPYRDGEPLSSIVLNATLFPRALFDQITFDAQIRYGSEEVDLASRAVWAGLSIIDCPSAANDHRPSPRSRGDYSALADGSRLYVTFKRYAFTERRRVRAVALAIVAPAHATLSGLRRGGLGGVRHAWASLALAARYLRTYLAEPTDRSPAS